MLTKQVLTRESMKETWQALNFAKSLLEPLTGFLEKALRLRNQNQKREYCLWFYNLLQLTSTRTYPQWISFYNFLFYELFPVDNSFQPKSRLSPKWKLHFCTHGQRGDGVHFTIQNQTKKTATFKKVAVNLEQVLVFFRCFWYCCCVFCSSGILNFFDFWFRFDYGHGHDFWFVFHAH